MAFVNNMADLESSLTAIDWLSRLTVGVANLNGEKGNASGQDTGGDGDMDSDGEGCSGRDSKPAYSYANLITLAINSSPEKRMTLSEIYNWICDKYPYYRDAGNGWKVSACLMVVLLSRLWVTFGIPRVDCRTTLRNVTLILTHSVAMNSFCL